jgi:hypothetical protein
MDIIFRVVMDYFTSGTYEFFDFLVKMISKRKLILENIVRSEQVYEEDQIAEKYER